MRMEEFARREERDWGFCVFCTGESAVVLTWTEDSATPCLLSESSIFGPKNLVHYLIRDRHPASQQPYRSYLTGASAIQNFRQHRRVSPS